MYLAELNGIRKNFGGVHALRGVDFTVRPGEVHALVGENGAGKSTLMRVLGGEMLPNGGEVRLGGKPVQLRSPRQALAEGVTVIHQELALAPDLTVAENIFLGALPAAINWKALNAKAAALIARLGFDIRPETPVEDLSVAHQQVVELAKALSRNTRIIVFDEPTAVLAARDAARLLQIIGVLRSEGVGVVYISHRLEEIFQIADRITVMKDGESVGTVTPDSIDIDGLIRMMVGRPLTQLFGSDDSGRQVGDTVLEVQNLSRGRAVKNVSFSLRRGEILGLGGLVGAGRTEVARLIFGADKPDSGTILLKGRPLKISHPAGAVRHGIALVPEDRKAQGVVLDMSIRQNCTMARLGPLVNPLGFIRRKKEAATVEALIRDLRIKCRSADAPVGSLSGGNQQKVVLAKWFHAGGDVIILDEPTRGVDVGAKVEIYTLIRRMAAEGKAVLVISSEHQELFGLCDRVLVMGEGELRGALQPAEYSEEAILSLAVGRSPQQKVA